MEKLTIIRGVLLVILLIFFAIQTLSPLINPVTIDIGEYIAGGGGKSWSIEARCWRLEVKLTSQYGDMRVTVVVDGRRVYDERTWSVDFVTDLGYGYHVIQVAVEKPPDISTGENNTCHRLREVLATPNVSSRRPQHLQDRNVLLLIQASKGSRTTPATKAAGRNLGVAQC